jgi:hypothetical protein
LFDHWHVRMQGYSMRIDHTDGCSYRFTMWPQWNGSALAPIWTDIRAIELYNHTTKLKPSQSDFDSFENVNLANGGLSFWRPRVETPLVAELSKILKMSFGFSE